MRKPIQALGMLVVCLAVAISACSDAGGDSVQDAGADAADDDGQVTPSDDGGSGSDPGADRGADPGADPGIDGGSDTAADSDCQAMATPGANCCDCHMEWTAAGTVFDSLQAQQSQSGVPVIWIRDDGSQAARAETDSCGNLALTDLEAGPYLVTVDRVESRTWHLLPDQKCCNDCHRQGGNSSAIRDTILPVYHTRIPSDNTCSHCHHYPESQTYESLATEGVMNTAQEPLPIPPSYVEIDGVDYLFDPLQHAITSVRTDIFAPGHFSMFDVILAVADHNGISIQYHFDPECQTHFIDQVDGQWGDYWYHFAYDVGSDFMEITYRRAYRWDEALWRPGVSIRLVEGENLEEIQSEYREEVQREQDNGHMIPSVTIECDPSWYEGNPPESHRINVSRTFSDLVITPHNLRAVGHPGAYSKPFQPGVVTSIDVLLTLVDLGELDLVTSVFYTYFAENYIDSYYVVAMGFPGEGMAHASGRQGFVYITNNGSYYNLPNNADRKFHMTSDISVVHAPDFTRWYWIELGDPYYEDSQP
jgi:hypothetical protein